MRPNRVLPVVATLVLAISATVVTLTLPGCGGDGDSSPTAPPPPPPPGGDVVTVRVLDNRFQPQSITIEPGTTVRWIMRGTMPGHTVTDNGGAFDSGFVFVNDGDTFERTFPGSEDGMTFNYACQSHQACCNMQGSVRVGENAPDPQPGY